jgi:hypothetical protein
MWTGCRRQGMHTEFWWRNVLEKIWNTDKEMARYIEVELKIIGSEDGKWTKLAYHRVWY